MGISKLECEDCESAVFGELLQRAGSLQFAIDGSVRLLAESNDICEYGGGGNGWVFDLLDEPGEVGFVKACECGSDSKAAFVAGFALQLITEFFAKFASRVVAGGELVDGEWDGGAADVGKRDGLLLHFAGELSAVCEPQQAGSDQDDGENCADAGDVFAAGCREHLPFVGGAILWQCEEADAKPVGKVWEVSGFAAVCPECSEFSEEDFGAATAGFALFAMDPGADGLDEVIVGELPCWFGASGIDRGDEFEITVKDLKNCLEI